MRILIPSDVFPPICGGSGWSSYYMAKALKDKGHEVKVIVPRKNLADLPFWRSLKVYIRTC